MTLRDCLCTQLNNSNNTLQNMKKTLLIAAATLAAGVISIQAQVYSQNIVGYANIPMTGGQEYLVTVPFAVGASNGVNEVFSTNLPVGSQVLIWGGTGYTTYLYDPTDPNVWGTNGVPVWYLSDDSTPASPLPTVKAGQGFFMIPASNLTNNFSGSIALSVGTSNQMVLTGGLEYCLSSVVPYSGAITNGNNSTGGANLNNLPVGSQVLIWQGTGFTTALYDPTDPNVWGTNGVPKWYQSDDSTPFVDPSSGGNVPTLSVGQGLFLIPANNYTWTTGL